MATITVDQVNLTIAAVCTAQEFAVLNQAIQANGTGGIAALFAQFIQNALSVQAEQQRSVIQQKLPQLTPTQLTQIVGIIGH